MQKYLPSKKFAYTIISVIIVLILILVTKYLSDWQTKKIATINYEKLTAENQKKLVANELTNTDTDADGLKDWEESLWKTDPQKADTDADGTDDGEEVVATRDPLKANTAPKNQEPNDKIDPAIIAAQQKSETEFKELSDTEKIARTLFSQYIAAKGSGKVSDSDKEIILNTANSLIEESTIDKYTLSDLKILNSYGTSTIKDYGNKLGQAFFTGTSQEKVENELVIIDRAVKNVDESILNGLDPIIEGYSKTVDKILLISVPTDAVSIHLSLLNDLNNLKNSLKKIQLLFTDPARAINGMRSYQNASALLIKDVADIKNYFLENVIYFDKTEYGYTILNII